MKACVILPNKWVKFIFLHKFCNETRFLEKFTEVKNNLHDRRSQRSWQISSLQLSSPEKVRNLNYDWGLVTDRQRVTSAFAILEQYMIIYRRNVNPHIQRLFVPCQRVKQSAKRQNSFAKFWVGSNYKLCISDQIIVGVDVELSCSPATLRSLWQQRIVLKGSKIPPSLG